ncbi:hypothetical protein [Nocardia spumae]|uniref:hypothetical protein n=1 Tax=Nocardia spumae TaxID=2887190 RepID=UPI001D1577DA|nr:hypothetical protein [Nocardia spumae]
MDDTVPRLDYFRQGDVLGDLPELSVLTARGWESIATPDGVALISQTCDIVQTTRTYVQVAKVVRIDGNNARLARKGKMPRFAHLPAIGDDMFADLEIVATVAKSAIAGRSGKRGVGPDEEVRDFSEAVARKFGRFAFPDEVGPWISKLENVAYKSAGNENSAMGRILDDIRELRIEAGNGWGEAPYELTLLLVVNPGVIPVYEDHELPTVPTALQAWLDTNANRHSPQKVAEKLDAATDPVEKYFLWTCLAEALAGFCTPSEHPNPNVRNAVADGAIIGEALSADELSAARYMRTVRVDVDHLC